eukprot:CAMPEP_0114650548 /NCGR_PEP_ID=MMETSP0191-20121206/7740_1 /TAXON_ID=126664 /ORGANISM="Sorites sp." /LENGTH=174 /DNA_ID=CAMNT_0001864445 /DNA_START=77 /DNA_END=601 /DNA_ORIENTATION=-
MALSPTSGKGKSFAANCIVVCAAGSKEIGTHSLNKWLAPFNKERNPAKEDGLLTFATKSTTQPGVVSASRAFNKPETSSLYTTSVAITVEAPRHSRGNGSAQSQRWHETATPLSLADCCATSSARSLRSVSRTSAPSAAAARPAQPVPQPISTTLPFSSRGSSTRRRAKSKAQS